jgi:hypothetical protein
MNENDIWLFVHFVFSGFCLVIRKRRRLLEEAVMVRLASKPIDFREPAYRVDSEFDGRVRRGAASLFTADEQMSVTATLVGEIIKHDLDTHRPSNS